MNPYKRYDKMKFCDFIYGIAVFGIMLMMIVLAITEAMK